MQYPRHEPIRRHVTYPSDLSAERFEVIDPQTGLPLLERVLKKSVAADRRGDRREEETTLLIIDAQSVKNTDTAELQGYDAGKKVSGFHGQPFNPSPE